MGMVNQLTQNGQTTRLMKGLLQLLPGKRNGLFLAVFYFPGKDAALGIVLVIVLGLAAGILPALQAMRLGIADALRRT